MAARTGLNGARGTDGALASFCVGRGGRVAGHGTSRRGRRGHRGRNRVRELAAVPLLARPLVRQPGRHGHHPGQRREPDPGLAVQPGLDRFPVQPGRVQRRHLHRREERLLLRAQRDHRRDHLEALHRCCAEADLRAAGLHGHGHRGPRPHHGKPGDLRLRRDRVPVRDERGGRHRRVAPGSGRHPVHHGERLLRVELAAGHRRQHLRRDQLAVRRAAGARRAVGVQPGQRRSGEHVLHHAAAVGRRQHLVERGHRRPVDLCHHRQWLQRPARTIDRCGRGAGSGQRPGALEQTVR